MAADRDQFAPGDQLGDFEIIRRLGHGGMGSVYLAEDLRLRRKVALKVILPELADQPDFRRRFETEAQGAAAINHPNIVPIHAAGIADDHLYIAMRYVEGEDLNEALDSYGPLAPGPAVRILTQVAEALDAAHAAGLVHRDVTPANILLEGELGAEGVYLTDFGLVRGLDRGNTRLTRTDQVIANLDYAAPEQIQGRRVDARTDVYALGCVLYRMRSGARPFPGTDTQKMWKIVNEPVPPIGSAADPLDPVIARATAKDPDLRFPSAGDLARAASEPERAITARLPGSSIAVGPAAAGYMEASDPAGQRATRPLDPLPPSHETKTQVGMGDSGSRRPRLLTIAVAAAALLAGAIAAAVLISSGGGGNDPRTVVRETTVTAPAEANAEEPSESTATEKKPKPRFSEAGLEPFTGAVYATAIPSGWEHDGEVVEEPPYHANLWRAPGEPGEPYVRVEGNLPAPIDDPVRAGENSRANTSQSDDYREIFYGADDLGGREALRWEFEVEGDRRIVYAFVECNVNLAMVGSASPEDFSAYSALFDEVAASTHTRCTD